MDTVELPVVSATTKILVVLDRIQAASRSAAVVTSETAQSVVLIPDLLAILRRDGDVPVSRCVGYINAMPPAARTMLDINKNVHHRDTATIIGEAPLGRLIQTQNESTAAALRLRATLCRCVKDREHVYEPYELVVAGKCNKDKQTVNCK